MFSKTKMTIAAALVLGSAGAALADNSPFTAAGEQYLRNPNAPVPHFTKVAPVQAARGLIEGRNVGIARGVELNAERRWERASD